MLDVDTGDRVLPAPGYPVRGETRPAGDAFAVVEAGGATRLVTDGGVSEVYVVSRPGRQFAHVAAPPDEPLPDTAARFLDDVDPGERREWGARQLDPAFDPRYAGDASAPSPETHRPIAFDERNAPAAADATRQVRIPSVATRPSVVRFDRWSPSLARADDPVPAVVYGPGDYATAIAEAHGATEASIAHVPLGETLTPGGRPPSPTVDERSDDGPSSPSSSPDP